jgi:hypothetical protein
MEVQRKKSILDHEGLRTVLRQGWCNTKNRGSEGGAMKHRFLKKFLFWILRKRPNLQPHLKLLLGAIYGNVELYGYMGTAWLLYTLKVKGVQNARRKK